MRSPYEILGVSPTASDDEIKSVYRELAKKYHPDNYSESPLREVAEEKMADINQAFDAIMKQRGTRNNGASEHNTGNQYTGYRNTSGSNFQDIRMMIQQNRVEEAEALLDGIPSAMRTAEWFFLKGSIYFSRGWLEDAATHFTTACRMEPHNPEYRSALNRMNWQRQGNFGAGFGQNTNPYNTNNRNVQACGPCDICTGLICADCCCECMGGDLIGCC